MSVSCSARRREADKHALACRGPPQMRLPHGPTLTYKINEYTLNGDVGNVQSRPTTGNSFEFLHSPLVVLSNFSAPPGVDEAAHRHVKLAGVMFQNLYPTLDVNTVKLADCRRVVLVNYNAESQSIEWRHYSITMREKGLSKGVRRLLEPGADMPDLSKLNDISELLAGEGGEGSDSEAEGESGNTVTMERKLRRRNAKRKRAAAAASGPQQQALRLREIGPRLTLELVKVEKDIMKGDVLYHRHLQKTPEEIQAIKEAKEAAAALKAERKKTQEGNVARKKAKTDEKKSKRKAKRALGSGDDSDSSGTDTEAGESGTFDIDDDDSSFYRSEVGEDADAETFSSTKRKANDSATDQAQVERLLKKGSDLKKRDKTGKYKTEDGIVLKTKEPVHPFGNPQAALRMERRKASKKAKLAVKLQERAEAKKAAAKGDGSGSWKDRAGGWDDGKDEKGGKGGRGKDKGNAGKRGSAGERSKK